MRHLLPALIALVALFALACGEKKAETPTEEAEKITNVKRYYQLNDPANAETPLTCKLFCAHDVDGALKFTDVTVGTKGQCKWDELKATAKADFEAGKVQDVPPENVAAMLPTVEGLEVGGFSDTIKFDCATIQITTTKRELELVDCNLKNTAIDSEKGWPNALEKTPAGSVEEAAFRLHKLVTLK